MMIDARRRAASDQGRGCVLMVANYAPDVGFAWWLMEGFWVRYAALASAHGMRASIAYPVGGVVPEHVLRENIDVVTMPFSGVDVRETWRSLRFIRERAVKVIYLTDRPFTHWSYALFRLAGVKWIINHDHTPGDRPAVRGVKAVVKWIWRRLPLINADKQLCVSPLIAERAVVNALIPQHRTVVVQNGIDDSVVSSDRKYAHKQFGIPDSAVICVTVARATAYKGIDFVVEIARRCLGARLSSVYFVHCGDGPELEQLKQMARDAGVADRVFFAGRRSDIAQILCSADLALHPSRGEAFSLSVLEYMRAGVVPMVPDIPSVSQAVQNGETGVVYPAGNVEALLERLAALVGDVDERRRLGDAARRMVADRYSSSAMMRQFTAAVAGTISVE